MNCGGNGRSTRLFTRGNMANPTSDAALCYGCLAKLALDKTTVQGPPHIWWDYPQNGNNTLDSIQGGAA